MMSRKNKLYIILIIIIFVGVSLLWLYSNDKSKSETSDEVADYQYQVQQPQLLSYSNGEKRWHVESETITQPKSEEDSKVKVILEDIKEAKLYSNNKLKYEVDAAKIIYFEKSKDIELRGDVCLEEVNGDKIFSDFFKWDEEDKNLKTDDGVRVEMETGNLTAEKMNLDLETNIIDFTDNVRMNFQVKGADKDEK
ncbi:MAG: LPS export ABC transporter periplasmic protein LptC [Bacillota bacterium]